MIRSSFEKIAYTEFNKKIFWSMKEGSLIEDFLKSNQYFNSLQFLLFIIIILEPLSYKEIKELTILVFKIFVPIKVKNINHDNGIINTWDKYREAFLANFKVRVEEIIKNGYVEYELQKTSLNIGDGLAIPLNPKIFTGMYHAFDPVGFPECYENYILAVRKIEKDFHNSHYPKPDIKEREYLSLTRARAFYIGLLQKSGKKNFLNGSELKKNAIIKFAEETWEGQSGKTVYEEVLYIVSETNPINKSYKELHLIDYEYGLKLYKAKFSD